MLHSFVNLPGSQESIENFIAQVMESQTDYPRQTTVETVQTQTKEVVEQSQNINEYFTVQEFFELYEDPIAYFRDDKRPVDQVLP